MATKKRRVVETHPQEESRTEQGSPTFKTPRQIVNAYTQAGVPLPVGPSRYADISAVDYQKHRDLLAGIRSEFEELPSEVRSALANNPANYLEFMAANTATIEEKGLDLALADLIDVEVPEVQNPNLESNDAIGASQEPVGDVSPPADPAEGTAS